MPTRQAPYVIPSSVGETLPDGEFLLPVCTTRERALAILDALNYFTVRRVTDDLNHMVDIVRALAYVNNPAAAECVDCAEGGCIEYPPNASFIEYRPQNPFIQPELVPEGYVFPPFYIANEVTAATYAAPIGAVVTTFERLPVEGQSLLFPASGLPQITVRVNGQGRVLLHLAAVNLGGLIQITADDDPLSVEITDLRKDLLSVPPENTRVIIHEREFTTEGAHKIDLIFLPTANDEFPFVFFGGGLLKVELCDFPTQGAENMPYELRQNPADPCEVQQSTDGGQTWTTAFRRDGCDEIAPPYGLIRTSPTNPAMLQQYDGTEWANVWDASVLGASVTNVTYNTYSQTAYNRYETINNTYNGSLISIAPNITYTGDGRNQYRDIALCWMCRSLIDVLCQQEIDRRAQGNALITAVSTAALGALVAAAFVVSGGTFAVAFAAMAAGSAGAIGASANNLSQIATTTLSDTNARADVACKMADRLKNTALSPAIFAASIQASDHAAGSTARAIAEAIAPALASTEAYAQFMASANDAIVWAELGLINCTCGAWTYVFDFTTSTGGNWLFNQSVGRNPQANGYWQTGAGYRRLNMQNISVATDWAGVVSIYRDFNPSIKLTEIQMQYNLTKGSYFANATYDAFVRNGWNINPSGTVFAVLARTDSNGIDKTLTQAYSNIECSRLTLNAWSHVQNTGTPPVLSDAIITRLTLKGTGSRAGLSGGSFT